MEHRNAHQSPLPDTRNDPAHLQLPIQAVKVWLDLAISTMCNSTGIVPDDWNWFRNAVDIMKVIEQKERIKRDGQV